jgi:hypothetical protein
MPEYDTMVNRVLTGLEVNRLRGKPKFLCRYKKYVGMSQPDMRNLCANSVDELRNGVPAYFTCAGTGMPE